MTSLRVHRVSIGATDAVDAIACAEFSTGGLDRTVRGDRPNRQMFITDLCVSSVELHRFAGTTG